MNNPVAQRDTRRHVRAGLEISHFRFDPLRFSVMPSLLLLLSVAVLCTYAQSPTINPQWLNGFWKARWIAHPTAPATQFGIFHFRKTLSFTNPPASFIVHVSADNHYRLFVDGRSVCTGPARSDLANWNFETVDLAPYLQSGKNVVAATVWNFGEYRGDCERISNEQLLELECEVLVPAALERQITEKNVGKLHCRPRARCEGCPLDPFEHEVENREE